MKISIFPGKYHQNGGFSMAMLVYRRVDLLVSREAIPLPSHLNIDDQAHGSCFVLKKTSGGKCMAGKSGRPQEKISKEDRFFGVKLWKKRIIFSFQLLVTIYTIIMCVVLQYQDDSTSTSFFLRIDNVTV